MEIGCKNIISQLKTKQKFFLSGKANNKTEFQIAREANLRLTSGKVVWGELKNGDTSPKKQWAAIEAAREKMGEISESLIIVSLYNQVRTYFTQNS